MWQIILGHKQVYRKVSDWLMDADTWTLTRACNTHLRLQQKFLHPAFIIDL